MSILYKNINTIVIDDISINNKLMFKLLKQHEQINNILMANDGLDAINKICNNMDQIDIVFIDNQMPKLNGSTVTKILRGINFNKIIIGITDCPEDELLEFNNSGIDYVFKKPFDKQNKEILFNFLNKNDLNRYPDKKLTLVELNLEWI